MTEPVVQLSRDNLKSMSARQIEDARLAGQLAELLGHTTPTDDPPQDAA